MGREPHLLFYPGKFVNWFECDQACPRQVFACSTMRYYFWHYGIHDIIPRERRVNVPYPTERSKKTNNDNDKKLFKQNQEKDNLRYDMIDGERSLNHGEKQVKHVYNVEEVELSNLKGIKDNILHIFHDWTHSLKLK